MPTCCCSCMPIPACRPMPTSMHRRRPGGRRGWGRFDVRIDGRSRWLGLVAAMMNWRSRLTGICTGDQAIFVERASSRRWTAFRSAADGGHRMVAPRAVALAARRRPRAGHTSGRRWEQRGTWRTIALMWSLRWRYFLGRIRRLSRASTARCGDGRAVAGRDTGSRGGRSTPILGTSRVFAAPGTAARASIATCHRASHHRTSR